MSDHRAAFAAGLEKCLELGADIIVNTDADNQYRGEDIRKLVQPILEKKADIVIGSRDIMNIGHFSPLKKLLQRVGSSFVRTISNTKIPDVTSGFRAYDRDAAMRLNVFSDFTYTLETLIQAGIGGLSIAHVQVQTNEKLRESRLFSSMSEYVSRSLLTVILIYTMYNPLRVFTMLALIFSVPGVVLVLRFFYFYISLPHVQTGHIQSLIIAAVLLVIGFQILLFGLLSDITANSHQEARSRCQRTTAWDMTRGRSEENSRRFSSGSEFSKRQNSSRPMQLSLTSAVDVQRFSSMPLQLNRM
ncbi:MAG: glycosyltransferase [Ignavibacteriales bacterium]|nr:glycosyltransferase [Ignavibacteriales bacterium]